MGMIRILPDREFKTTTWSGGTTTELFIWPEGSSYGERRFSVRISTALVELESSVFTRLEGVERFLTPLCPGFLLTVNGEKKELRRGEVLCFSGEDEVLCEGAGRDLNLMLKAASGDMRVVKGDFTIEDCRMAFLFADGEQAVSFCEEEASCTSVLLPARSFSEIAPGKYRTNGNAVLFVVYI